jgi:uncharacterized DUF497 family protein
MVLLAKMYVGAYSESVRYVWDEEKAAANLKKHRVDFLISARKATKRERGQYAKARGENA